MTINMTEIYHVGVLIFVFIPNGLSKNISPKLLSLNINHFNIKSIPYTKKPPTMKAIIIYGNNGCIINSVGDNLANAIFI